MDFMVNMEMPVSPDPDNYNITGTPNMDLGKMATEMKACPAYGEIVRNDDGNNANINSLSAGSTIAGVIIFLFALTYNH